MQVKEPLGHRNGEEATQSRGISFSAPLAF